MLHQIAYFSGKLLKHAKLEETVPRSQPGESLIIYWKAAQQSD